MPRENRVLILGTGIAGLTTALKIVRHDVDARVTLVCKDRAEEGATRYAQGGIAAVAASNPRDRLEEHVRDTVVAGAGLCHASVVRFCVEEGPARVRELMEWGVGFMPDLHREGGHGERRIWHVDDRTGEAIEQALLNNVKSHPRIEVLEHHVAIDLITEGKLLRRWRKPGRCLGAYVLDTQSQRVLTVSADAVVLATGGAGKVYLYTTNPDTATGDGVAMAFRAGAEIANLEFFQFHPTCLYHPELKTFLISEAVRGEGAVLKALDGKPFMNGVHPQASLAPRDIVARAIDAEMKRSGASHVLLDATGVEAFDRKFPQIFETLQRVGLDPRREPIPVVPAAHYMCGGVRVDERGRTQVGALYALGETSFTGLHGANRLASNSLLEAVVYADRVARDVVEALQTMHAEPSVQGRVDVPSWDTGRAVKLEEQMDISAAWREIRTLMWHYAGIIRSDRRLERAKRRLEILGSDIQRDYWDFLLTRDLIELRNLHTVATLIVDAALQRKESRGLHWTVDHPDQIEPRDSVLVAE